MDQKCNPVGVFDSGIGGISTLKEMIRELPREHFIYYGDTANAPYGTKSTEEVIGCVRKVVEHLLEKQIKALVIACNTATGAAAAVLRKELTIPVIAMEPALKPASEKREGGSILVMATPLTLQMEKFNQLMRKYGEGAVRVPCPGLMELVETDDGEGALEYLKRLFSQFDLDKVDAVVLGCTHYVFLREMIRDLLPLAKTQNFTVDCPRSRYRYRGSQSPWAAMRSSQRERIWSMVSSPAVCGSSMAAW